MVLMCGPIFGGQIIFHHQKLISNLLATEISIGLSNGCGSRHVKINIKSSFGYFSMTDYPLECA